MMSALDYVLLYIHVHTYQHLLLLLGNQEQRLLCLEGQTF